MYLKINPTVSSPSHSPPSTSTRVGCCLERTVMITNKSKKKNRKLKKKNGAVIELNGTCKLIVPKTRKAGISYLTICSFLIAVIAIKEQQARPILDRRPCSNSCISFQWVVRFLGQKGCFSCIIQSCPKYMHQNKRFKKASQEDRRKKATCMQLLLAGQLTLAQPTTCNQGGKKAKLSDGDSLSDVAPMRLGSTTC